MHVDEMTMPPAHNPDRAGDMILWIIPNEGWTVHESFPTDGHSTAFRDSEIRGSDVKGREFPAIE